MKKLRKKKQVKSLNLHGNNEQIPAMDGSFEKKNVSN